MGGGARASGRRATGRGQAGGLRRRSTGLALAAGVALAAAGGARGAAPGAGGEGGHCLSPNPFAGNEDCVQFGGDLALAEEACIAGEVSMPGASARWALGPCPTYESEDYAGECAHLTESGAEARSVMLVGGPATCEFLGRVVCGTFIPGGTWSPSPLCGGGAAEADGESETETEADGEPALPPLSESETETEAQGTAEAACPPPGFDAVADLNLTAWAEAPWYPLAQMPLAYQDVDSFYCVRASYKLIDENTVQVQNTAQEADGTSTPSADSPFKFLRAVIRDLTEPAKLAVGPPALPPEAYGSYWVVAAGSAVRDENVTDGVAYTLTDGPADGPFDWGIVSGGAPKQSASGGGCVAGTPGGFNEAGLWLFSREPLEGDEAEAMREAIEAHAEGLGLGVGDLEPVQQGGSCEYPPVLPVETQ